MSFAKYTPDWYDDDVVCVALLPIGQPVDWVNGHWEPDEAVWPPEGTFLRLQSIAERLGASGIANLDIYQQSRLSAAECQALLSRWEEIEQEVERTPAAGWVAAMGLLLKRCTKVPAVELLIEGP